MGIIEIKNPAEFKKLIGGKEPVIVKFSADWCGDCRTLRPHFEGSVPELESAGMVVARFSLSAERREIDGRKKAIFPTPEHEQIRAQYAPAGFPTVALIREGRVIASSVEDTKRSFRHFVQLALQKAK
ncbi:MAG: thioredoxin family protein [Candidatus Micrarchaeota archaeon]